MRFLRLLPLLVLVFGIRAADTSLQATLARMDVESAKFHGMRSDVKRVKHTEIVHDDEVSIGTMAVRRQGSKDLRMKIDLQTPNPRKVWFLGNKVQVYYPKMNTVQEYELGKANALKDQFIALGFGSTSKELQAAYTVQLGGAETVAGQPATRIVLTPKDEKMRSLFPKVELWLADGVAVQQKLYEPGGDYTIATYTNIQQANITDADVKLDVPKDAKRETPLK